MFLYYYYHYYYYYYYYYYYFYYFSQICSRSFIDWVGETSSLAKFSFMYLYPLPDDRLKNDRNNLCRNNNTQTYSVRMLCLCGMDC
jgi:hypothetical protein